MLGNFFSNLVSKADHGGKVDDRYANEYKIKKLRISSLGY